MMSEPIGLDGGILIGAESTYGVEATTKVAIHATSATLGVRRGARRRRQRLTYRTPTVSMAPVYVDGEIVAGMTDNDNVLGVLFGAWGAATDDAVAHTKTYAVGTSTPDNPSLTVAVNHGGGHEWTYTGLVPSSLTMEFTPEDASVTAAFVGKAGAKEATASTITRPSENLILSPADYGSLFVSAAAYDFNSFRVQFQVPTDMAGQDSVSASTIRRAFWSGSVAITGTIELDLTDDSSMDSITLLAVYLATGILGDISLGNLLTLSGCRMIGDPPALESGVQKVAINFEAEGCDVVLSY